MNTYTKVRNYELIISPVQMLHETASFFKVAHNDEAPAKPAVLENYFNDIYHLFLNKLVKITHETDLSKDEHARLKALFDELLKVKSLLQKES